MEYTFLRNPAQELNQACEQLGAGRGFNTELVPYPSVERARARKCGSPFADHSPLTGSVESDVDDLLAAMPVMARDSAYGRLMVAPVRSHPSPRMCAKPFIGWHKLATSVTAATETAAPIFCPAQICH